jgi:tetratricopeptide (TPR) repeat protein
MSADPTSSARPDPQSRPSFELFEEHYFHSGEWDDLVALYRARIDDPGLADDPRERARLHIRRGRIFEERIGDEEAAIASYSEAAALAPGRRRAFERLRRLYTRRRSWGTVLQVAELEVEEVRDPVERARLFREMGDIWEHELGDPEQAEQLHGRARLEEGDPAAPAGPATAPEAAEPATVERAWRLATEGDTDAAVAVLQERIALDPNEVEALDMLLSVLERAGRTEAMPDVLSQRAAATTDASTRAAVLTQLGVLNEQSLGDLDAARSAYERAFGTDPTNEAVGTALARVYRTHETWDALAMLLEARIAHTDAVLRVALLCELGDLRARHLGQTTQAKTAYEQALEIDPGCEAAQAGQARIASGEEQAPSPDENESTDTDDAQEPDARTLLARSIAELEANGEGTSPSAVRLRLRLAEPVVGASADLSQAIEVLEPCLESESALRDVALPLRRLYEQAQRHKALVTLARRMATLGSDPRERADWQRLGARSALADGCADAAVELYGALLDECPGDAEAESALLDLHRSRGEARPLLALLRRVLHRIEPGHEAPLHVEAATLLETSLGDPDAAFVHWRRAVALDPAEEDVLDRALRCAELTGGALRQLDLLELATSAASAPGDRAQLLARRGALLTDALDWREEGTESWRRSLELDPNQPAVRERLEASAAPA